MELGMGREKKKFTLYQRKMSSGKKVWYYRTYDDFGNRTNGKSTGQSSKTKAENYCLELFRNNLLIPDSSLKLSQYIKQKNFFQFGKCAYSAENGIKKTYAGDCLSRMNKHILPLLGNLKFDTLSSKQIESWQRHLLIDDDIKLSVKSVRECKSVLRIILNSARSDGFLNIDVFDRVKKLPRHNRHVRGILTEMEVRDLFDEKNYETYWKSHQYYYIASLVACFSGMRQGEILAITPEKIFPTHIYVNASWGKNGLDLPRQVKQERFMLNRK